MSPFLRKDTQRLARRSLVIAIPIATVIGLTAIVYGAVQQFQPGEALTSSKMNTNFDELDSRLKTLEGASASVPTGTVIAFAGSTAPAGWLMCDGALLNGTDPKYAALHKAIGTAHGGTMSLGTFNLPDYRGRFLRGVDDGAARDPDRASRTAASPGGNTGDAVGTTQFSSLAAHSHTFGGAFMVDGQVVNGHIQGGSATPFTIWHSSSTTASAGGAETRPTNAAVIYLIKL